MSKIKGVIRELSGWLIIMVLSLLFTVITLYTIVGIIAVHSKFPIVTTATVLNGKRELVYIDSSKIQIGTDNVYYSDKKGRYTNSEAKGYIYYDKKENSIIYRDGDYYAGFKLDEIK